MLILYNLLRINTNFYIFIYTINKNLYGGNYVQGNGICIRGVQGEELFKGIAFISDTLVRHVKPDSNMVYYKLNPELSIRDVCFCYKHNRYVTKAMEELIRIAQETYSYK